MTNTIEVARLRLCTVLLMNDKRFPWLILLPQRDGVREIYELSAGDRAVLIEEIASVSTVVEKVFRPDKINVGALGNIVPRLHIHVIGRFENDIAWPGPVWGFREPEPYEKIEIEKILLSLRSAFGRP